SGDKANPGAGHFNLRSIGDHPDLLWRPQPLSVQNAAELRDPGSSQESTDHYFPPALRGMIYAIVQGAPVPNLAAIHSKLASLDLHFVITKEEAAAYPPPLEVGDFWRYRVTHLDTVGYRSKPFILHVECVGYKDDDWVF